MQHPQDRGCSMVSPTEGSAQPGQKDQPQRHKLRGDSKYYRLEFPHFEMCPKYFQLQSYWFFLLFLEDVLYCIQIHIWKRLPQAKSNFVVAFWLLGPKEGILHTQPTSLRSPDTHVESGWKTWPKGLTHKSDHYGPFLLLNTHTKNSKQIRPAKCYHGISQDGFPTRSKQLTLHRDTLHEWQCHTLCSWFSKVQNQSCSCKPTWLRLHAKTAGLLCTQDT